MNSNKKMPTNRRSYPPFWEKFVPIAIGIIVIVIVILIAIALSVVLGVFPI
jgi:hypothetical protein